MQRLQLRSVIDLNLGDPGIALSALVDELSLVLQSGVTRDNLPSDRREHVRSRLNRLDSTDRLAGADLATRLGELDEDDVAEGVGSVLRDTNLSWWWSELVSVSSK